MAHYVMGDIHGEADRFHAMLKKIQFSEDDILILLGDVIDPVQKPADQHIRVIHNQLAQDQLDQDPHDHLHNSIAVRLGTVYVKV